MSLPKAFELGPQSEKSAHKILHPKMRMTKLRIKPCTNISLIGELDEVFRVELREATAPITIGKVAADSECVFLAAESSKDLAQSSKIAKFLGGATALGIVYPQVRKEITENVVIASGRNAGLKDAKVVGFSPTHTGAEICARCFLSLFPLADWWRLFASGSYLDDRAMRTLEMPFIKSPGDLFFSQKRRVFRKRVRTL